MADTGDMFFGNSASDIAGKMFDPDYDKKKADAEARKAKRNPDGSLHLPNRYDGTKEQKKKAPASTGPSYKQGEEALAAKKKASAPLAPKSQATNFLSPYMMPVEPGKRTLLGG